MQEGLDDAAVETRLERHLAVVIADSLRVTMPALGRASGTRGTADAFAHDLYLRGRFEWNNRTPAGLSQSVSYFRQAIARDPGYAASYAGLADALINLSVYAPSPDMIEQAEDASDRAISIDRSLGEAHVSRAMIRDIQGDAEAAEREYELAIALGPNYAPAHHWHAFGLEARGHHAEAMEVIRTAYALDPLSVAIGNAYGGFLYFDRDWAHAIDVLGKTLQRAPEPLPVVVNLAAVLSASGRDTEALAALRRLPPEDLARAAPQAALAIAQGHVGARDSAQIIIHRLARSGTTRANAMLIANVRANGPERFRFRLARPRRLAPRRGAESAGGSGTRPDSWGPPIHQAARARGIALGDGWHDRLFCGAAEAHPHRDRYERRSGGCNVSCVDEHSMERQSSADTNECLGLGLGPVVGTVLSAAGVVPMLQDSDEPGDVGTHGAGGFELVQQSAADAGNVRRLAGSPVMARMSVERAGLECDPRIPPQRLCDADVSDPSGLGVRAEITRRCDGSAADLERER